MKKYFSQKNVTSVVIIMVAVVLALQFPAIIAWIKGKVMKPAASATPPTT